MGKSLRNAMKAGFMIGLVAWVFSGLVLILLGIFLIYSGSLAGAILVLVGIIPLALAFRRYHKWGQDHADDVTIPEANTVRDKEEVLFHWILPTEEWKQYVRGEIRDLIRLTFLSLVILAIMGWIGSMFLSGVAFTVTVSLILVVFLFMSAMGLVMKLKLFSATPEVLFKPSGLVLNGKVILYRDEFRWPRRVRIHEERTPVILEITMEGFSRSRYTTGTEHRRQVTSIRVPIPRDKLSDALLVKELIESKKR